MKYLFVFLVWLPFTVAATPIDDAAAAYSDVTTFNNLSYKGERVQADTPGELCVFLGYEIALNQALYTPTAHERGYQLSRHQGGWTLIELPSNAINEAFAVSITCGRHPAPVPVPVPASPVPTPAPTTN